MKACPEIADYAASGINNWRDLMITAAQVRGYLAFRPRPMRMRWMSSARRYRHRHRLHPAASPKHQFRRRLPAGLTEKARAGEFSVGPMLMAALKANGVHPQLVTGT